MSISDELMWRFYLLLTDLKTDEIEKLKSQHPMQVKKDLARLIVTDFHSAEAAKQAAENWEKQFQKDELPENVPIVRVDLNAARANPRDFTAISTYWPIPDMDTVRTAAGPETAWLRSDKVLFQAGLCASAAEGARKIREGAVKIQNKPLPATITSFLVKVPSESIVTVGRKVCRLQF
jgi:tyrosyl-tRNA synthetase